MLEAAQAHLDFAARTRKEAEEAAARDAKALAEKRALEDAEREARRTDVVLWGWVYGRRSGCSEPTPRPGATRHTRRIPGEANTSDG